MNAIYLNEIQNRVLVPCTDLNTLCNDIPMEIFKPFEYTDSNAFYGMDMALKSYAGLPHSYHLKAHYSHMSIAPAGGVWVNDYNTLPMLFTWAPSHEEAYKKVSRKPMHSIGPIIHYAQNAYTEEKIATEKKRLGKNALFFPTHSSHYEPTFFSIEKSLYALEKIKKDFDTIRISVYWKDYLDGIHKEYINSGYECVTSGHIFDPYFLPRLKGLLSVADHTMGNHYGSNIAYAIYMKKPFTYLQQEITSTTSNIKTATVVNNSQNGQDEIKKFLYYFSDINTEISDMQYKLCNHYFGYDKVRSREELLTLIRASEDFFHAIMRKQS